MDKHYKHYLLRLWRESDSGFSGRPAWRFSLEDPHTGRRVGFATLEKFVEFLMEEIRDHQKKGVGSKE